MYGKHSVALSAMAGLLLVTAGASQSQPGGPGVEFVPHAATGKARFVRIDARQMQAFSGTGETPAPERILAEVAPMFGVKEPARELALVRSGTDINGGEVRRYQQMHDGVPVIGGELVMRTGPKGATVNGEASPGLDVDVTPGITAERARRTALEAVAKWRGKGLVQLEAGEPELSVLDPRLIRPGEGPAGLVWKLEVRARDRSPIREFVAVDARRGGIRLHFNQVDMAKNRLTYSSNSTGDLQGAGSSTLVCDESDGDACSNGADVDADLAHLYAGDTYDFFAAEHGRDSIDDAGMDLISNVDYADGFTCPNAYWNNGQMVYCDGYPQADDVVGHELTHGVTENTSGLFYYFESGAINESMSDVWGEFVDLTNGGGTDTASVRWEMGEDVPSFGVIRDMQDPGRFNHPDRMTSGDYHFARSDNGGVHINSGVNNKAVYLMVDGDTFNGETINGIGIGKVADIYYRVQTRYLTSGSSFADLSTAVSQACRDLIGTEGIVDTDCDEVDKALAAVEMEQQPNDAFAERVAPVCPAENNTRVAIFEDDLESNSEPGTNWTFDELSGSNATQWSQVTGYATSGNVALFAYNTNQINDSVAEVVDSFTMPEDVRLFFRHSFDFEDDGAGTFYDGAVVEYSTDGGSSWNDVGAFHEAGQDYIGTIDSCCSNPLAGRDGFVSFSAGYQTSRYDLSGLAGEDVKFRLRLGTDSSVSEFGWFVDDFQLYNCNDFPTADAGDSRVVNESETVQLDASGSSDPEGDALDHAWSQTRGSSVSLSDETVKDPTFTAPTDGGDLEFEVTVTDAHGGSSSDTVVITVNEFPVADAGSDLAVQERDSVTLDGTASTDPEGAGLDYQWSQTSGENVTLDNASAPEPNFTAPSGAATLKFRLTVTDPAGATDDDTVTVDVEPIPDGGGGSLAMIGLAMVGLLGLWRRIRVGIAHR